MNHFLVIRLNFKKVDTKKGLLNFTVNREKRINGYLKSLKSSRALSVEQHKKIKAVVLRSGILYGLCKLHTLHLDPFFQLLEHLHINLQNS